MSIKDDRIQIRITSENKKIIQKRAIDKGMALGEYILYACMKEINGEEIKKLIKYKDKESQLFDLEN